MRILQVVQYYYPWIKWSSTGKFAYKLTEALSKRGVDVGLLTTDYKGLMKVDKCFKIIDKKSFNVIMLHVPKIVEKAGLLCPVCCNSLESIIKEYDIVHIHEYMAPLNICILRLVRKLKIPYVIQPHGNVSYIYASKDAGFSYSLARLIIDRIIGFKYLSQASALLILSEREEALIRSLGISFTKIFRIPQAIDLEEFQSLGHSLRKQLGIEENEFVILYLGRIVPVKGIDLLLKSLSILINKYHIDKKIRAIIAGPYSKYEEFLKSLVKELGIEKNVFFLGPIFDELKVAALKDANLFALTSRYESFPTAVLEAFACKTPVLATRVGVLKDSNFKDKVVLTDPDPESIANKLYDIVKGKYDLNIMTKNAYAFISENFTYEKAASKLLAIYRQLIKG